MDEKKIIKKVSKKKVIPISIRITKARSEWLHKNNYSITGIFEEGCKDLGYKDKEE